MSFQPDPAKPLTPTDPFGTPPGLSWRDTFIKALTQPNEVAYQQIAADAPPNDNKAYRWIFICGTIAWFISALVGGLIFPTTTIIGGQSYSSSGSVLSLVCAPVVGIIEVLGFALGSAIIQAIARALGGTGTYARFRYTYAAFSAPMFIVTTVIAAIPVIGLLSFVLSFYSLYINILVVKTVNQFDWGRAIVAAFVIPLVFGCVIAGIVAVVVLGVLGPAIGNVYSNIAAGI